MPERVERYGSPLPLWTINSTAGTSKASAFSALCGAPNAGKHRSPCAPRNAGTRAHRSAPANRVGTAPDSAFCYSTRVRQGRTVGRFSTDVTHVGIYVGRHRANEPPPVSGRQFPRRGRGPLRLEGRRGVDRRRCSGALARAGRARVRSVPAALPTVAPERRGQGCTEAVRLRP
jgi:hypothetical protein